MSGTRTLKDKSVLIVEDNVYLALDLCAAIQDLEGRPVGPVYTVADALAAMDSEHLAAAIVDCELPGGDVISLIEALTKKGVPFVLQGASEAVPEISEVRAVPVLVKPIRPHDVASILVNEVSKTPPNP